MKNIYPVSTGFRVKILIDGTKYDKRFATGMEAVAFLDGVKAVYAKRDDADSKCVKEYTKNEFSHSMFAPFFDSYFTGLTMEQIAELAKKSIRLTTQQAEDMAEIESLINEVGTLHEKVSSLNQERIYTCNCKTPMYKAAPELYESLEMILENAVVNGIYREKAEQAMKKARGKK